MEMGARQLEALCAMYGISSFQCLTAQGLDDIRNDKEAILAEIRRLLPILKENGGYIFAADHSIPNDVPFENMKAIIALVKELGRFD